MSDRHHIEITRVARFERAPGIKLKKVGGSTAAYVGSKGAIHVLNPTAELLLRCLETPLTRPELVTLLAERTDGAPDVIERDLAELLPELLRLGLIRRAG